MKSIAPLYLSYRQRIINGLSKVLIFILFMIVLVFLTDVNTYRIVALVCLGGFIGFNIYKLFQKSKRYIKSIEFSGTAVRITIIDQFNTTTVMSNDIKEIRIKLVELFIGFNRIGRNFKLQIDIRKNGKFEKVFDQYEIGGGNLELFKKSCALYSEMKIS
ncbi:hypothetical protein [Arachidicoccus terrestris]|uniref:hypothetical protein n=1 Tax=Arachidicoccus terrestris TaxID=2875539 RepID=UPI001CC4DEC6|nr:hypothetical protein [Arachidicoccus terrestris]UAY54274.1 hypothetical protein K9M52_12510 [Arachidicoccus terrestris]